MTAGKDLTERHSFDGLTVIGAQYKSSGESIYSAGNSPAKYENGAKSADAGANQVRSLTFSPRLDGDRACSLRRGNRPVLTGNEKPSFFPHLFHVFLGWLLRKKASEEKTQRSRGPDIGARWQSGSEQRLTAGQTAVLYGRWRAAAFPARFPP